MIHFSSDLILFFPESATDLVEGSDGGTQAAQPDAHLMQGIGIAGAHAALVDDDLPQAILRDGAEGLAAGEASIETDLVAFSASGVAPPASS